jgi:hypothetical protein
MKLGRALREKSQDGVKWWCAAESWIGARLPKRKFEAQTMPSRAVNSAPALTGVFPDQHGLSRSIHR